MVFISRGRGRGANRGRGRGVGEVSFESRPAHPQGPGRDSRQAPESLRITVGNDQFRDRSEDVMSASQRLGPPKDSYMHEREADYRREDEMYRREAEMYGQQDRERFERDRSYERRDQFRRDPHARPEERDYGDRRGLGSAGYEHPPSEFHGQPSKPLFPSASKSPAQHNFPPAQPAAPASAQASGASRPLKSILKKKPEPVPEEKPPSKPSGLPGIANYMDDIEDEDKFLYGGDDDRDRRVNERDRRESSQYRQPQGVAVEDMRPNIRSAAQSWQPSAPEKTVSGVVSEFVNAQREFVDNSVTQQYRGADPYHSQPVHAQPVQSVPPGDSGGNDLWSMLAKSVQTVQQQQQNNANQYETQTGNYQQPYSAPSAQTSYSSQPAQPTQPTQPAQPVQEAQAPGAGHDPTIENILKSIGFDFEMSKRMQEKAKQTSGEAVPQAAKPGEPEFINQGASFIGTQMSHEEMISQLGPPRHGSNAERQPELRQDERKSFEERDRRESSETARGRLGSPPRRTSSPTRRTSSPSRMGSSQGRRQSPEKLQRGCSPVSADGSPPPPMFNLPPITIKRRPNLDRRSPDWEKKRSLSRSPTRDSDRSRNKRGSRSPSWNRSIASYGRKRSPSPVQKRSPRNRSRSPVVRMSPVIKRTFNLDDLSPAFRRRVSPTLRQRGLSPVSPERSLSPGRRRHGSSAQRSPSPGRRRSPGRRSFSPGRRRSRSPGRRSRSPGRRRSISPVRRRSRSPGRRRSRSPGRRKSRSPGRRSRSPPGRRSSRSPGRRRSRSPRRHSPSPRGRRRSFSPRGRKRGPSSRSRSRDRKVRRSTSRDRSLRSSPGRIHRSSSRDRSRKRSRSWNRSPRRDGRSVSVSTDSDIDGPANKQYFSSPLRLPHGQKPKIPRYYDYPPPQQGPPPDFSAPPFPGYGPPPGSFHPVAQPGMVHMGPPGPPQMIGMPPPGIPPVGPPVSFPYPPPSVPGGVYVVPGPPNISQPPPMIPESEMAPPGTEEMPLNLPSRPNITEVVSEDRKEDKYRSEERRRERSRSRERTKDRRDDRRSERTNSSSNRTVLPPKPRPKAEDIEIKASTTSNERVVVLSGKSPKSSSASKDTKKIDQEKEKAKILKEKETMVTKIMALETEFNNLKKQEFDLRKRTGKDNKPDPILIENKKLLEEIRKEIAKLTKQKKEFESKHSAVLKTEPSSKREIRVTPKRPPVKDDKSRTGEKKTEKEEFKVEKGKLMKHYFHDAGDHWCKPCNSVHPNIQDFMHHLSSYKHKQTYQSDFRPWMDGYKASDGMIINKKGIRVPLPGIEFMMPVSAYYCQLCKVFLGDVSFGADHFKCESHYINYKKYLADNPIYEKKNKEERDKALPSLKAEKKAEQDLKAKEDVKQKNTEKDARVRENEKKWDQSVDNLDDVGSTSTKQDTNKSQIKLSLRDRKSENNEKGFGKFNWTKDKKTEEATNGQKTPEAGQEKEKSKINFNISGKSAGKTIISKTGAPRKNPLLPPWQPVGKRTETAGKPGEKANLDQFLTTNSGEGKVPVITEKKKVSAKEILEAFSGKYKDKDTGLPAKKDSDLVASSSEKKESVARETVAQEKKEETKKSEQEIEDEKDKRMMGIDPDTEVPLAIKVPPPPRTQNVPLPDHKPSATVDENEVHKIFNSEKATETTPQLITVDLTAIPVPDSEMKEEKSISVSDIPIPGEEKSDDIKESPTAIPVSDSEMKEEKSISVSDIPIPGEEKSGDIKESPVTVEMKTEKEIGNLKDIPTPGQNQTSSDKGMKESILQDMDKDTVGDAVANKFGNIEAQESDTKSEKEIGFDEDVNSVSTMSMTSEGKDTQVKSEEVNEELKSMAAELKTEEAKTNENLREKPSENLASDSVKNVEANKPVGEKVGESVQVQVTGEPVETKVGESVQDQVIGESVETKIKDSVHDQVIGESVETKVDIPVDVVDKNEQSVGKSECEEKGVSKLDVKSDDSEFETEVIPPPQASGRGRGRGRGRKRGRGRGRGKARSTPARTTRSSKSLKEDVAEDFVVNVELEIINTDSKINENTVSTEPASNETGAIQIGSKDLKISEIAIDSEINKSLELNSGVQIGKSEGDKSKKSVSPRRRRSSVKFDPTKVFELEEIFDEEDAASEASGVSMHMDSDFEVVDDLEDMEVLDETG